MPINRYDQPIGQRYVSSYVPLPLEQIGQMAKQYSQAHLAGKEAPHALDQLDQALKAAPIHYDKKKALMDRYYSQMNDIVSNAKPEDYAKPEYQQKINNLVYQFKNDPEVSQIMNTKQWWDKEYMPYVNDPDKSNKALIYDVHETSPGSGKYTQTMNEVSRLKATPYDDREKAAWDIVGDISKSGNLTESGYDFSKGMRIGPGGEHIAYNKYTNKWEGVTKDKLDAVVGHSIKSYGDTKAGKHHIQELLLNEGFGDDAYNYDYNKIQNLAAKDDKYKPLLRYIDDKISKHLTDVGFKQVGIVSEKRIDNMTLKDDAQARANKAQEDAIMGLPQTAPDTSALEDITKEIPEDLKHIVSYDKQPDGTYKVNIDMKGIGKGGESKAGYGVIGSSQTMGTNDFTGGANKQSGTITKDTKRLLDYLYNAAGAIGYPKDKVSVNNASDILTKYHEYSKNISPQEILDGPLQKVLSNNIINDRENYTVKDSDGKIITNEDQNKMKDFKVNSRTFKNGEQIIKGSYFDDGEYKTVTIIPHSNQSNNYFNIVGSIKEDTQKFFKTGDINKDTKESIKDFESKTGIKFTTPGYKGLEPISIKSVPGQPYQRIITMSDKENRKDIKNYLVDLQTGTKSEIPGGLDGAIQYISTSWYTNTPEGHREALQLTNAKGQYEGLTEGD